MLVIKKTALLGNIVWEVECAQRFCQMVDEIAQFFRPKERMVEFVSLSEARKLFQERISELQALCSLENKSSEKAEVLLIRNCLT